MTKVRVLKYWAVNLIIRQQPQTHLAKFICNEDTRVQIRLGVQGINALKQGVSLNIAQETICCGQPDFPHGIPARQAAVPGPEMVLFHEMYVINTRSRGSFGKQIYTREAN